LSKEFELIVFTASHRDYANKVVDLLDPDHRYFSHRLFRNHCFPSKQGVYIKDLRVINRKLSDLILVDNALYSYGLQLGNGVPIIPFYNCKEDTELLILTEFLLSLKDEPDVRPVIQSIFKYDCYQEAETVQGLYNSLFKDPQGKNRARSSSRQQTQPGSSRQAV
jgi:CTD small phosphatase-like protein 2